MNIFPTDDITECVAMYYKKKSEYKKKNNCIFCGKKGETKFFTRVAHNGGGRILVASCPISGTHIEIGLGVIITYQDYIKKKQEQLAGYKREIIIHKNRTLYSFQDETLTLNKFESISRKYEDAKDLMNIAYLEYRKILKTDTKMEQLKKEKESLAELIIDYDRLLLDANIDEKLDELVEVYKGIKLKQQSICHLQYYKRYLQQEVVEVKKDEEMEEEEDNWSAGKKEAEREEEEEEKEEEEEEEEEDEEEQREKEEEEEKSFKLVTIQHDYKDLEKNFGDEEYVSHLIKRSKLKKKR